MPRDGAAPNPPRRAQRPLLGHRRRRLRAHRGVAGRGAGDKMPVRLRGRYRCRHLRRRHRARLVRGGLRPRRPAFRAFIENDCELVVIATPVAAVDDYLARLRDWGYTGVVTDTISTKGATSSPRPPSFACACALRAGTPHGRLRAERHRRRPRRSLRGSELDPLPRQRRCPRTSQHLHELVTGLDARVVSLRREETTPPWPW